jgi:hypothetical protein
MSSALHAHTDVEGCKRVFANDKNRLVDFETEDFGLDEVYGRSIDTDETTALPSMGDRCSSL